MRMFIRGSRWASLGLLAALWFSSPLWGAGADARSRVNAGTNGAIALSRSTATAESGSATAGKTAPRDPVALAFALPKGTVLNSRQEAAYNKLKKENESPLRSALQQISRTNDKSEKAKLARQANDTRATIKTGIHEILAMPAIEAQKMAAQEYSARKNREYSARAASGSRSSPGACPCGR
jgi:hypothetical protein